MLVQVNQVTKRFSGIPLFSEVSMSIDDHSRIGLVGRNGTGKSTLLKMIAGEEEISEGEIIKKQDLTIGFLDQHNGLHSDLTIWEEMLAVFAPVRAMEQEMRDLEIKIAESNENDENFHILMNKYHRLQEEFDRRNGYGYESEIKMVLHGFKFPASWYHKKINHLSGGQKTRLALAKLLLEKNDLLILDEPTNHLDIDTLDWLEKYLASYRGALLMVSHDRYFLDHLVEEIYELDYHGNMAHYLGNYSHYLEEKSKRLAKAWKDYEKQQKEIHNLEKFIAQNIVRASTTKRAQSRRKKLEKMDRIDQPTTEQRDPHFSFHIERESGDIVLQADQLAIGYGDNELARQIELDIRKGDAVALVGPNGVGKTTLLKTLVGQIPPLEGEYHYGSKVDVGYFDQEQLQLNPHRSVLDELWDERPTENEEAIRTFLGSFLFSGDDVKKQVASLSGGEKARLALAKLAINHYNFLVLDEPTNHLDIDSKEILEGALIDFPGTILFVSHDRYFINKIADKVVELDGESSELYLGDYDYYLSKKEQLDALAEYENSNQKDSKTIDSGNDTPSAAALDREEQKAKQRQERRVKREIKSLEEKIEELENELTKLEKIMTEPDFFQDPEKSQTYTMEHENIQTQLDQTYEEWESIIEEYLE